MEVQSPAQDRFSPLALRSPSSQKFEGNARLRSQQLALQASFGGAGQEEAAIVPLPAMGTAIALTAQEIVAKLNERLSNALPGGIESLSPEDTTAEATAERIVSGISALFEGYQRSNPELSTEELLASFMKAARSGVEEGYNDAFEILDALGAFEIDGVQSGVESTKALIEEKLIRFEATKRQELGISPSKEPQTSIATDTATALLAQGGKALSIVA